MDVLRAQQMKATEHRDSWRALQIFSKDWTVQGRAVPEETGAPVANSHLQRVCGGVPLAVSIFASFRGSIPPLSGVIKSPEII